MFENLSHVYITLPTSSSFLKILRLREADKQTQKEFNKSVFLALFIATWKNKYYIKLSLSFLLSVE